jgi:putative oxygen-independent coproporphyrinogen III oxidase
MEQFRAALLRSRRFSHGNWTIIAGVEPFGVYVHIPFCAKRCDYCAFATWTDRSHLIEAYVDACRKDLAGAELPVATSVFFGGGTPSLIEPRLLASILSEIDRVSGAEVTVECNPDTVTPELFATYAAAGVNRISLGVQSTVPHVLASLGRTHNHENVVNAVALARDAGIERVNLDIIYGAKGESVADWQTTVSTILALDPRPTHVSAYGLTVEPGTPLARDTARHPDDDDQADKYALVDDLLSSAGFANYEISNWSLPGDECQHNILYWQQGNYRGIGCAAHSHQDGRRWWNIRTPERYIDAVNNGADLFAGQEFLDEPTRRFEALELAMRMTGGVPVEALPVDALEGFVEVRDGRAMLTRSGRLMANEIATKLIV